MAIAKSSTTNSRCMVPPSVALRDTSWWPEDVPAAACHPHDALIDRYRRPMIAPSSPHRFPTAMPAPADDTIVINADRLRAFAQTICSRAGCDDEEAAAIAGHLVDANLTGHDS